MRSTLLALVVVLAAAPAAADEPVSVYDLVLKSKKCHTQEAQFGGDIECNYQIGKDLHIVIVPVGEALAGVKFFRSSFDGDFYGSVGMMHGCVIIQPGKAAPATVNRFEVAFISPKNGKVYRTWEACKRGE
jgi:hypothetical protein